MRRILSVLFPALILVHASCGSGREEKPTGLTVRHEPNPVKATLVKNEKTGATSYRWTYRTEVINTASQPLKVVSFNSLYLSGKDWKNSNYTGKGFDNKHFSEWYVSGDSLDDGWIPAGAKAVDSNNWSNSSSQTISRTKWQYRAIDEEGNEIVGEQEVFLVPYYEEKSYRRGSSAEESIFIRGSISDLSGEPLSDAQVRLVRHYRGFGRDPYDLSLSDKAGRFEINAPISGLYKFFVYSAGYNPLEITVPIDESRENIEIDVVMYSGLEDSRPVFEESGRYLEKIQNIDRMFRKENETFFNAYSEYKNTHGDITGFRYDWSVLRRSLMEYVEKDSEEPVRCYAALLIANLINSSGDVEDETMDWITGVLPPESFYWSGMPQLPNILINKYGVNNKEEYASRFFHENPDRAVRAHALARLRDISVYNDDEEKAAEYLALIRKEYGDVEGIAFYLKRADTQANAKIKKGNAIPEFSIDSIDDSRSLTNSTYRGRYYLVHFWATYCDPCKKDMKYLHEAFEKFKDRNFDIISISVDKDVDKVKLFRKELWPLPWDNAIEPGGSESAIGRKFEVFGVPRLILVDPHGIIVETGINLRGDKLVPFLEKCIKKS